MTSDSRTINNATDAYVTARRPNLPKPNTAKLILDAGGGGDQRRAFLFFTLPFPFGANIDQGLFRLYQSDAFTGGSVTVTVQLVTAKFNVGRLTWNNQPGVTATNQVTLTKNNPGINTLWEFDLKTMLQGVSTSGVWWGLRVTSNNNTALKFYSAQGPSTQRPEMALTWSDLPLPLDNPYPSGGRAVSVAKPIVGGTYEDDSGNTQINAIQVHYKATNTGFSATTGFSSPTWDSGTQFVSAPALDTSTVVGAPAVTGSGTWWTARVQDSNGVWSEWMDPEFFIYVALPAATLDNPPAGGTVTDATPPLLWTMANQTAYRAIVYLASDPTKILWNSGKISTTIDDTTIPDKVLKLLNTDYTVELWLWDNQNRERNGGNDIFVHLQRTFQFVATGSVTAVTSVVATQVNPWPWVDITFDRSSAADEYNILRDGQIIAGNVPAADLSTGSTHYSYRDKLAAPRVSHVWSVQAVVNSVASNKVDSNSVTSRLLAPFMMELDASNPVYFLNPALDPQQINIQEVQQPVNGPPVLLTQYISDKYQGHLTGVFADNVMPGVTARDMRDRFKKWKRLAGNTYILYMVDEVMTIVPYNMTYKPRAVTEGVLYDVEFDFFEVDPA